MSREYCITTEGKSKRLSEKNRIQIESWLKDGISKSEIARRLGVHRSTAEREIRRGSVLQQREVKIKPCYENYYSKGTVKESRLEYFAGV